MQEKYEIDSFINGLEEFNIELSEKQIGQFLSYYELLLEWNKVMNLTAITEFKEVVKKHFLDSLSLIMIMEIKADDSVADIGTGAGFPGIPLKIVYPDTEFLLLDSLNKRVKFLLEVKTRLNLKNIELVHGRAEDYAKNKSYREQYDLAVSRAVANLSTLSEYCLPFVKEGGSFISYKSGNVEEEIKASGHAVSLLGGSMKNQISFQLPGSDYKRTLVQIEKVKKTPARFPRKAGLPSKEPIA